MDQRAGMISVLIRSQKADSAPIGIDEARASEEGQNGIQEAQGHNKGNPAISSREG